MTGCLLQECSLWVQSSLCACPLVPLGASSLSSVETPAQRARPPAALLLLCLLETEAGSEEEVIPTVLGKILVRKDGMFSAQWGSQ